MTNKELTLYLPYDLQVLNNDRVETLNDIHAIETYHGSIWFTKTKEGSFININKVKPLLKPLDTLTRIELEQQGFDSYIDYCTWEQVGKPIERLWKAPFNMIMYLISEHYDVFDLINQGIAVNKFDYEVNLNVK